MSLPDYTIIIQFVIFILTWMIIGRLLFKKIALLLEERTKRTGGARQETERLLVKVEELSSEYQARVEEVKREAREEREKMKKDALKVEKEIVEQAKQDAARTISDLRVRLEEESTGVREDFRKKAPELSRELVSQVLGRRI